MTAYALSLLTKRKFLINLSKPCQLERSLEPVEFNWTVSSVPDFEKLTKHHMDIRWYFDYVRDHLLKINLLEYKKEIDIIKITTGMNLVKHFTLNKNHHERLKELGFSIQTFNLENYFYEWYNKLFKWNSKLGTTFNEMLKLAKPIKRTKLICVQIRIGVDNDFQFMHRNKTKLYWNFIKEKFLVDQSIAKNYKLFVTTDNEFVIDEAITEFGMKNVIAFKNRSSHFEFVYKDKCSNLDGVYLDFNLLGQCDKGLLSHSGFGLVGVLLRKKLETLNNNFYVYSNPDDLTKSWGKRDNFTFVPYSLPILYLEDKLHGINT